MISSRFIIIIIVLAVFLLGLYKIFKVKISLYKKHNFTQQFLDNLNTYTQSRGNDSEAYTWLIHRSKKMQKQLGIEGIFATYRPPHSNYQYSNYSIILQILPELRTAFEDRVFSTDSSARHYYSILRDTLVRHLGSIHDSDELNSSMLKNPVIWLREGMQTLTVFPLTLLNWLGAISNVTVARLTKNRLFQCISVLISIVGFFSAVMGIILGWEQFTEMVKKFWL